MEFIEDEDDFDINNVILNAINIHNNNTQTTTKYKPIELFWIQVKMYLMKSVKT